MSIAVGISATKTGFDLIKGVRDLVKGPDVNAAEVSARLLELQELMLDARSALNEAEDEKKHLEARIAELTRKADFGAEFKFEHGVYWRDCYPYCPVCWDVRRDPVRLSGPVWRDGVHVAGGKCPYTCPIDKSDFALPRNLPQPMPAA
ncbi:MAG: hypothetical protein WBY44_24695 [Bryobacteraceae bacterium]